MAIYKYTITDQNFPPPGKLFVRLDTLETDPESNFGGSAIQAFIEIDDTVDLSDPAAVKQVALAAIESFCEENNMTFDPKRCMLTGVM